MSDSDALPLSVADDRLGDRLTATVDALLAHPGRDPILTVALAGDDLPAGVIAALITALRRLRAAGGALVVEPQTLAVRDALALHGLDRIFALPLAREGTRRRAPAARTGVRAALAGLLSFVLLAVGLGPCDAAVASAPLSGPESDAAMILDRVIARNPELNSYQGRVHIDVKMTSFPWLRQHLDGTTYYKRPSNYEVVFDHLPGYAHGFERLYTDVGDPQNWEKHFVITYVGATAFQGHSDYTLHMVQRVRGMIDHETVLVDPEQFTIDQIRYDYYNGGHITMTQSFSQVGSYLLLSSQDAEIVIPHVHAVAAGQYDSYHTNVAVDDTVFSGRN